MHVWAASGRRERSEASALETKPVVLARKECGQTLEGTLSRMIETQIFSELSLTRLLGSSPAKNRSFSQRLHRQTQPWSCPLRFCEEEPGGVKYCPAQGLLHRLYLGVGRKEQAGQIQSLCLGSGSFLAIKSQLTFGASTARQGSQGQRWPEVACRYLPLCSDAVLPWGSPTQGLTRGDHA